MSTAPHFDTVTNWPSISGPELRAAVADVLDYSAETRKLIAKVPTNEGSIECRTHVFANHLAAFQAGDNFRSAAGTDPFPKP